MRWGAGLVSEQGSGGFPDEETVNWKLVYTKQALKIALNTGLHPQ